MNDKTPSTGRARILLADDHVLVRQGVRLILETEGFDVVAEAADGMEAVRLARETHPDVAVLDLLMPLASGLEAAREILQGGSVRVMLLTGVASDPRLLEALRLGVSGCVLKSYDREELARAIREVLRGHVYLSPSLSRTVVDAFRAGLDRPVDPLTPRERHVLQLIAEGKKTRQIAELLCISIKTVESHRARTMRKLGLDDTAGLVRYALEHGLTGLHPPGSP